MKTITKIFLTLLVAASAVNAQNFTEITVSQLTSEDSKVFEIQPKSELVGGNSVDYLIKYGITGKKKIEAKGYLYAEFAPDKNNEMIFGLGGDLINHFDFNPNFSWRFGGRAGVGFQNVKGKTTQTSTSATKVSFVMSEDNYTATTIKYEEDTYLLSIGLVIGFDYQLTKNLKITSDFVYRYDNYQVSYCNQNDTGDVLNQITFSQNNYSYGVGLQYFF